MGQLINEGLI